ncbi:MULTISPECIES: NAD(P)H:quinone oxidoreductase [Anaerococcus]|uniref:NAD(P)H:quinone oxidoreductase n=1 Tax=Anaerococcus nagyae TaxID=1755241 RepID=A0A3E2TLA3_9FIRM|nr:MULTISPECIES: NAD(P)H:quinone oxidoreductase [Anaerococcus]MBP2069423.1 NAD(P)H dehydrogenase (quinone) [Anaerococcus nagyae]MDU1829168.1 NAD(P)H:quinone oxidoreductase [Anaerococcus sp.]MDU1864286.1 NAD(P)H:quinone oxidoreductase [Anaerococcus sp.]MDU2353134.1 NAD(P)H:quinone oxidoreductase [Anaerococcus sp.]MDU2565805.1 NAD(P)H:quinone oxidoreductase [Anaerococcus sp.]
MRKVRLSIVFYSQTGVNYKMASYAKKEAEKNGAEVKLLKVSELRDTSNVIKGSAWDKTIKATEGIKIASPEDLVWADAIIISSPTRFGNISSQMKDFIDSLGGVWAEGKLVNKFVTAFSSSKNLNGGQEQTIRSIYTSAMHWGSIIVPTGYTDQSIYAQGGNPYGVSATQADEDDEIKNDVKEAIEHQTQRLLEIAGKYINN